MPQGVTLPKLGFWGVLAGCSKGLSAWSSQTAKIRIARSSTRVRGVRGGRSAAEPPTKGDREAFSPPSRSGSLGCGEWADLGTVLKEHRGALNASTHAGIHQGGSAVIADNVDLRAGGGQSTLQMILVPPQSKGLPSLERDSPRTARCHLIDAGKSSNPR